MSEALRLALEQHLRNLHELELQAAQYPANQAPINIVNAIRAEKAAIEDLETRLSQAEQAEEQWNERARPKRGRPVSGTMQDFNALLEPLREKIHALQVALTRLETDQSVRLAHLEKEIKELQEIVNQREHVEPVPRALLIAGGVVTVSTLLLLILLSMRIW